MVKAAVDNHGVENSWDTLSKSHYAGAAYDVSLLCSEEGMAEGGLDSSGPQGNFPPSKRNKSVVWAFSIRMLWDSWLRMAALTAGAARRKLLP